MRLQLSTLALLVPAPLAHAQQAGPFSGVFVTAFGQYGTGVSTQRDNGFALTPAAAAPVAPVPIVPPVPINAGGLDLGDGAYGFSGGFGGGGIGYDFQFDHIVVGLVGDIGGGRASGSSPFCGTPAHTCGTSVNAVSDVRGRVGYAFGPVLVFASGGLAVDHLHAYDALFGAGGSSWQAGFVVGGGLEYEIAPHVTVAAEYLHTAIGPAHLFDIVAGVPERVSFRSETARVSLNYYFSEPAPAPVVARY